MVKGSIQQTENGIFISSDTLVEAFGDLFDEYTCHIANGNIIISPVSDEYYARIMVKKFISDDYKFQHKTIDGLRITTIKNKWGDFSDVITKSNVPAKIAECIAAFRLSGNTSEIERFEKYIIKA